MKRWQNFEWLDTVDRELFANFFSTISCYPIEQLEKCNVLHLKNSYSQYIESFHPGNELAQKNMSNQIYRGYKNYEKKQKNKDKKQSAINVELSNRILKKLDTFRARGDKELSRSEFISMLIADYKVKDVKKQRIDNEAISTSHQQGGLMKSGAHSGALILQNQTATPFYMPTFYSNNHNNNFYPKTGLIQKIDSIIQQLEQIKLSEN
ncbi:hypothetical protein ABMY35_09310 [Pseudoalteromonas sp. BZB3]|uniref:hypothetical protein n=1 Tax=Pseudoalteromonas sp. BZB3 TaxID=3136670 RepID=UPI0032C3E9D7